jgi:hypothetical protein
MSNQQPKKASEPVEGEGSYTATRNYNQHLAEAIDSGDLEAGAAEAGRAMEGPEREELERAAADAKKGPKQAKAEASKPNRDAKKASN